MDGSDSRDWSAVEFEDINFGDKRLNDRFVKTAQKLSNQPTSPINKACDAWSDTKGAYRLFDNDRVSVQEILRVLEKKRSRIDG